MINQKSRCDPIMNATGDMMSHLIHLIYCSAAKHAFSRRELSVLLINARRKNTQLGRTDEWTKVENI